MIMINKEAILRHESFHRFESKIHFISPTKGFLPRGNDVHLLCPHALVVINSTKEAVHL